MEVVCLDSCSGSSWGSNAGPRHIRCGGEIRAADRQCVERFDFREVSSPLTEWLRLPMLFSAAAVIVIVGKRDGPPRDIGRLMCSGDVG